MRSWLGVAEVASAGRAHCQAGQGTCRGTASEWCVVGVRCAYKAHGNNDAHYVWLGCIE